MSNEIHYRGTRADLRKLLKTFIASVSTGSGVYAPYVQGIKLRIGMVALACIQEAFVAKASGGAGDDGITWEPLKKETIAQRPVGGEDAAMLKTQGITKRTYGYGARSQGPNDLDSKGRLKRGFLTEAQDARWKKIFWSRKVQFMAKQGMGEKEASELAAQIAWATLKSEGAKTKLEALGNRHVKIGRSSGRLYLSLSPGADDPERHPLLEAPPPAPEAGDRILREEPGAVVVGSNVEYAGAFHAKRPLWPQDGELPAAWAERIREALSSGIEEAMEMIVGEAGRGAA